MTDMSGLGLVGGGGGVSLLANLFMFKITPSSHILCLEPIRPSIYEKQPFPVFMATFISRSQVGLV